MSDTSVIAIRGVRKTYVTQAGSPVLAVDGMDLSVSSGEIVSLLGPSGCGKTTLLNMVAGFEGPSAGKLSVNGETVTRPSPMRGVVFQQPALFPWLTVKDNILFGPRSRGIASDMARERLTRLLEVTGLRDFAGAYPRELSGGMNQRVALARVLINEPEVLLLDEPYGALDAQTRLQMQDYLMSVQALFKTTMLLVTHDIDESIYVSDRVVIMSPRPGRVVDILEVSEPRPRSREFLTRESFSNHKRRAIQALAQPNPQGDSAVPAGTG